MTGILGPMRILFASSEVYPFSKTGGLADVVSALPEALVALGHEVLVVSPWYKTLKPSSAGHLPLWIGDQSVPFDGGTVNCGVGVLESGGVRYAFVGNALFERDTLYGYSDDVRRFCLFTRAVPQVAARLGFVPDVAHAHDWHAGYLPAVLQHGYHLPDGFAFTPSVFTIHNVQYQGSSGIDEALYWLRLPGALSGSYINRFGSANAMQAALGFAHHVTTVSPTYAQEIQTAAFGYGLDGTLRHISDKLSGILNGIDTGVWNPASDPNLPRQYSGVDAEAKLENKDVLCQRFHLDSSKPLLAVVSRLADQKGIDIFIEAIPELLWQDWNVLVLGSGEAGLEDALRAHTAAHPGRVASYIGYDEGLAHHVYAAADALCVPSRFEPCGLTQMIAMRYGSLPIARATGGLVDTIDHDRTGFLFEHAEPAGLLWATGVARGAHSAPEHWHYMMKQAAAEDFTWRTSAQRYADVYEAVGRQ